jgi:hypothetical protein
MDNQKVIIFSMVLEEAQMECLLNWLKVEKSFPDPVEFGDKLSVDFQHRKCRKLPDLIPQQGRDEVMFASKDFHNDNKYLCNTYDLGGDAWLNEEQIKKIENR